MGSLNIDAQVRLRELTWENASLRSTLGEVEARLKASEREIASLQSNLDELRRVGLTQLKGVTNVGEASAAILVERDQLVAPWGNTSDHPTTPPVGHYPTCSSAQSPCEFANLGEIKVSPEELKLVAYGCFFLIIVVGAVLTSLFADLPKRTVIFEIFAYDNVCILFDYPPATYVLPTLWVFFLVPWELYLVMFWLRARNWYRQDRLSLMAYRSITCMTIFECASAAYFIQVFANKPYEFRGEVRREQATMDLMVSALRMHMTPFTIFTISLLTITLKNTYYFSKLEEITPWEGKLLWLYTALFVLVTVQKVLTQSNASSGSTVWKSNAHKAVKMGKIMDPVWTIMATVIPLMITWAMELRVGDRVKIVFSHVKCNYSYFRCTERCSWFTKHRQWRPSQLKRVKSGQNGTASPPAPLRDASQQDKPQTASPPAQLHGASQQDNCQTASPQAPYVFRPGNYGDTLFLTI